MMISLSLIDVFLLAMTFLLGILSTVSDVKNKKISNRMVFLFIGIGLVVNLAFNLYDFRINYIINFLFALLVGFVLWYVNFWNAGDGKLFLAFVSVMPVNLFFLSKTNLYSYNLIVYTFVPIFFVFLFFLIMQTSSKEFMQALKESFRPVLIFNISVAFFSFQWVMDLLFQHFGLRINLFLGAIILFFVFDGLEKILKVRLINIFYATSLLRIFLEAESLFTLNFITYFLYQLVIFLVFVYFFLYIAYFKFGVHVKIPKLKPGMLLCEKIIKHGKKYTVVPDIKISLFTFFHDKVKGNTVIEINPNGLTEKDIAKIQDWNKSGKMEVGALLIQKRIPYAPFQFLGVIIFTMISVFG